MSAIDDLAVPAFVRRAMAEPMPAPITSTGWIGWARQRLFGSIFSTILTLVGLYLLWLLVPPLVRFVFIDAVWSGTDREACLPEKAGHAVGACWPFIWAKLPQLIYGFYPDPERWRVNLTFLLAAALLVPLLVPTLPYKRENAIAFFGVFPVVAFFLLVGGAFGLPYVDSHLWGGLLVTLVVAVTGIVASLPLGILLALGRRSKLPIVRTLSVGFIEFWRGVPLVTVLFFASYMLPLFLPPGTNFDKLTRALIATAIFSAAYMAEVVRGGLQAIPRGQFEAAQALGLPYWNMMNLIVLPQALKIVIPGIVNSFISLFKDTTLVTVIGLYDLLNIISAGTADAKWASPQTGNTGYFTAAALFWVFCFSMSRYSQYVERRLNTGHKR